MRLTYTVGMTDLFWMWLTSWFTPATVAFGLFFVSALLAPGDHPRALDVAVGIGLIVAAFTWRPSSGSSSPACLGSSASRSTS